MLYEIAGEGSSLEEVFLDLTTPDEEVAPMTALIRSELLAVRTPADHLASSRSRCWRWSA